MGRRSRSRLRRDVGRVRVVFKNVMRSPPFDQAPWPEHFAKWAAAWDLPGLEERVNVVSSTRMRVSLGRYLSRGRQIRIAEFLLDAPPFLLQEVLCHEFAHAAVHARFGLARRPHGAEWRSFMHQVGCAPRARIPGTELARLIPPAHSRRVVWLHRCPVCQAKRSAGRPVPNWRCVECVSSGLSGRLEIERIERGVERVDTLVPCPNSAAAFTNP